MPNQEFLEEMKNRLLQEQGSISHELRHLTEENPLTVEQRASGKIPEWEEESSEMTEADKINNLAGQLNLSAQNYNLGVGQYNQKAKNLNAAIKAIPEAGLYSGSVPKIDIYLTSGNKELVHTLAHELGHALGLAHTESGQSIMYPFTNEVLLPDVQETQALQLYCKQKNWEIALARIKASLAQLFARFLRD